MELYAVPRNSYVKIVNYEGTCPGAIECSNDEVVKFKNLDGSYGRCINKYGDDVYLRAWQEVEIVEDIPYQ